jgi:hypothetical protein
MAAVRRRLFRCLAASAQCATHVRALLMIEHPLFISVTALLEKENGRAEATGKMRDIWSDFQVGLSKIMIIKTPVTRNIKSSILGPDIRVNFYFSARLNFRHFPSPLCHIYEFNGVNSHVSDPCCRLHTLSISLQLHRPSFHISSLLAPFYFNPCFLNIFFDRFSASFRHSFSSLLSSFLPSFLSFFLSFFFFFSSHEHLVM